MTLEDPGQDLLGGAADLALVPQAVDVGAVDEVDPQLDGALDSALGLAGVLLPAKTQAAGQARHLQAGTAELDVLHASPLGPLYRPQPGGKGR